MDISEQIGIPTVDASTGEINQTFTTAQRIETANESDGKHPMTLEQLDLEFSKMTAMGMKVAEIKKDADNAGSDGFEADVAEKPRCMFLKIMGAVLNIVFYVTLVAIIVGSTIFAFSKDPGKSYFGYRFYNILSNSMVPNEAAKDAGLTGGFQKGDLILVQRTDPEKIEVGDIITFAPDTNGTAYLTHRVVEKKTVLNDTEGLFFVTRGDANNTDDPAISAEMVIGKKVAVIPHVGTAVGFVRNNFVPVVIFIIAGFGLIVVLRMLFAKHKEVVYMRP